MRMRMRGRKKEEMIKYNKIEVVQARKEKKVVTSREVEKKRGREEEKQFYYLFCLIYDNILIFVVMARQTNNLIFS